jgi:glycosyltransferase involved in cell wall biosynthesis
VTRGAEASEPPLVSVVMPVYNAQRFLAEAIESVLNQTHARLELVLVDDGSHDRSVRIARDHARRDGRVRVFENGHNRGIVATRNRAFAEADPHSEYFAIMDADDICLPERLRLQIEFLQNHTDHALVGGNTIIIDERGREVGRRRYPSQHEELIKVITRYNPIAQPSVLLRRTALEAVGAYDAAFPRCEDYELWLRLAARFKVANLPVFTLQYRLSGGQEKSTHLRDLLRFSLQIQRQWLFHPSFFQPANVLFWLAEHMLLPLPEPLVLKLFKLLTYRR